MTDVDKLFTDLENWRRKYDEIFIVLKILIDCDADGTTAFAIARDIGKEMKRTKHPQRIKEQLNKLVALELVIKIGPKSRRHGEERYRITETGINLYKILLRTPF